MALSADGDTALIGGPQDAGEHEEYYGAVWVFVREGTTWHEQQKLVAKTGATEKGEQGSSVALSADGNTALVGAMDNEYKSGDRTRGGVRVHALGLDLVAARKQARGQPQRRTRSGGNLRGALRRRSHRCDRRPA